VTVTFALAAPADVEVAVTDAKGKIVRHLAAGLSQTVTWDGLDDLGKAATGGPFKARVRAGMGVRFGRLIGGSPYTGAIDRMPYRAPVNGLAVDGEGNLYIKLYSMVGSHGNSGLWPWHIRKFDKQGKYLATLLPYAPSTDPAKASGFTLLEAGDGAFIPATLTSLYPVFYAFGNELYSQVVNGSLLFVHSEARLLNFFRLDGSNALRTAVMWPPEAKLKCPRWLDVQVALSPDGRTAYYSNVAGTAYDGRLRPLRRPGTRQRRAEAHNPPRLARRRRGHRPPHLRGRLPQPPRRARRQDLRRRGPVLHPSVRSRCECECRFDSPVSCSCGGA